MSQTVTIISRNRMNGFHYVYKDAEFDIADDNTIFQGKLMATFAHWRDAMEYSMKITDDSCTVVYADWDNLQKAGSDND